MTPQEKREFILTITLEEAKIEKFIQTIEAEKFVKMHQKYFKDYYLGEPGILGVAGDFFDNIDFYMTIIEKYRAFYDKIGLDKAYDWIGDHRPKEWLEYEMGLRDSLSSDDENEECDDSFMELYGETWSSWGPDAFLESIIEEYYEYMNDEQTEGEYILND